MSEAKAIPALPPLHDHHNHVSLYAAFVGLPDLEGLDETRARERIASLPRDRLSIVKGWRGAILPLGPVELRAAPPCVVVNSSLHGFAISEAAFPFVSETWPELAEHRGDIAWGERHLPELFVFYGAVAGLDSEKLSAFISGLERVGTFSAEDMTVSGAEALAVIRASNYASRVTAWATPEVYRRLGASDRGACAGIKLFLDGSLGAKSAALDAPFSDGKEGMLVYRDEELASLLSDLAAFHTRLSIHAIGHRAIEQALQALGRLVRDGIAFPEIRLEHVQFISEAQARRCKDLGILLSMQPNFNSDSVDYADRLIPRHRDENDPFRMLIDRVGFVPGKDLLFGSDGMPQGPRAALEQSLSPPRPGQRLDLDEFVAGYGEAPGAPRE